MLFTSPSTEVLPLGASYPYGTPAGRIPKSQRIDPGPWGLVTVNAYGTERSTGSHNLTPEALASFRALRAAAKAAGFSTGLLRMTSSYRSPERQAELAAKAIAKYGEAAAGKWVALGLSEHITGRTVDFYLGIPSTSDNAKSGAFEMQPVYQWLKEAAPLYGWNPYPNEPWHWSYNVAAGSVAGPQPGQQLAPPPRPQPSRIAAVVLGGLAGLALLLAWQRMRS